MILALFLFACPPASFPSGVTVDVVGPSDAQWEAVSSGAFKINKILADDPRLSPAFFLLRRRPIGWRGKAPGVVVYFPSWLPDDDVGYQLGSAGPFAVLLLLKGLKIYEVAQVFVHELGHVLGLEHSKREDDVMYKSANPSALNKEALSRMKTEIAKCLTTPLTPSLTK